MASQTFKNVLSYAVMVFVAIELFLFSYQVEIPTHLQTVTAEPVSSEIFFPSMVSPRSVYLMISPAQGTIIVDRAQYGLPVKKGQPIFTIYSPQIEESLQGLFDGYFRAKSDAARQIFQSNGNKELYRSGLISKVTYMDSVNQMDGSELTLFQAEVKLKKLLAITGQEFKRFQSITLENIKDIQKLFVKPLNQFTLSAPATGTLLFPNKSLDTSGVTDMDAKKLQKGSIVHEGQTVAMIGDMGGLSFSLIVNENNVHSLKVKQKATVTGGAFPGVTLNGYINAISEQANTSGDTSPMYTATVVVPKISDEERKVIDIGMSAEVHFVKESPPVIRVPLGAVKQVNGQTVVFVKNKDTGVLEPIQVQPGLTDDTSVVIQSGLSAGDEIVVPD